jgi:23S rRNA (cytidine1920-2'-O)/16S rRNA (cytidine1409-2'-O)-methyltransferase
MKSKTPSRAIVSKGLQENRRALKTRLDILLTERGLAPSRERAQALLLAGQVRVNGVKMDKPGSRVDADASLEIVGGTLRYSSRGGLKLEGALEDFNVAVQGKTCLDIGSSTGGFTDCLLQHGAAKVFAVDVTVNQLDWKLQKDQRVVMIERNARYLRPEDVPEAVTLVTMDLSFISVSKVLPCIVPLTASGADFLVLIKPQFELEKRDVGKGGIVRDSSLHAKAVDRVIATVKELGLEVVNVGPSRVQGSEGNQEFFLHARRQG